MREDILRQITDALPKMSKGQKRIGQFIIANYDKAAFITAALMGKATGVSESTVVRFSYALGLDGYPSLQRSLQEIVRSRLTTVQRIQLTGGMPESEVPRTVLKADMNNLRATLETLDYERFAQAITYLFNAKKIYVLGLRGSAPLAQFLTYQLNFVLDNVVPVTGGSDIFEQMIRIDQDDLYVGISFPRYSNLTIEGMRFAHDKGAKTIAITDSPHSPLALLADNSLVARSDMVSFADSLVAPLSVINALIVAVGQLKRDELSDRFNQLERMWAQYNVYVGEEQN